MEEEEEEGRGWGGSGDALRTAMVAAGGGISDGIGGLGRLWLTTTQRARVDTFFFNKRRHQQVPISFSSLTEYIKHYIDLPRN